MLNKYVWIGFTAVLAACGAPKVVLEPTTPLPEVNTPTQVLEVPLPPLADRQSEGYLSDEQAISGTRVSTYLRGRRATQVRDFDTASKVYLNAVGTLDSATRDTALRRQAFSFALAEGNFDIALPLAKTFTLVEQTEATVWLLRMVDALKTENYTEATTYLNRATQDMPPLQHFALMRTVLGLATGEINAKDVEAKFAEHEVLSALRAQWAYHQAQVYTYLDAPTKAQHLYELAHAQDPNAVFNVLAYGQSLPEEDATKLLTAFQQSPANALVLPSIPARSTVSQQDFTQERIAEGLFGVGMLMWAQGLDLPALQILHLAHLQGQNVDTPTTQLMTYYIALVLEQVERPAQAQALYSTLTKGLPRHAAITRLAHLAYDAGDTATANKLLKPYVKSENTVLLRAMANEAYTGEDFALALQFYDALLAKQAEEPLDDASILQLHFARGVSHERLGSLTKANAALEQALALDPENPTILNYLGYMWIDAEDVILTQDKLAEAFSYISKAATLQPNNASILDSLGWAYYKRGEYAKAKLYLLKAIELEPSDATILEHMGDVSAKLGDAEKAKNYWRSAVEAGPLGTREKSRLAEKLGK